jgi:hypothetical protein
MRLRLLGLLVLGVLASATATAAATPLWTPKKVQKALVARVVVKCPVAMWWTRLSQPVDAANAQAQCDSGATQPATRPVLARCVTKRPHRAFACYVQLADQRWDAGGSRVYRFRYGFCLAVTTRPRLRWKITGMVETSEGIWTPGPRDCATLIP